MQTASRLSEREVRGALEYLESRVTEDEQIELLLRSQPSLGKWKFVALTNLRYLRFSSKCSGDLGKSITYDDLSKFSTSFVTTVTLEVEERGSHKKSFEVVNLYKKDLGIFLEILGEHTAINALSPEDRKDARLKDRQDRKDARLKDRQERKDLKAELAEQKRELYGEVLLSEIFHTKKVCFYQKGFVSISGLLGKERAPEKLTAITVNTGNIAKKSGVGRAAGMVLTMGYSALGPNIRGDIYITISTDRDIHLLTTSTPTQSDMRAAMKIEAAARGLLAKE